MVTIIQNSSGIARHLAASSLASMNLGALSLRQFGETVNWNNSTSYQLQVRTPWACLSNGVSECEASIGPVEPAAEAVTPTIPVGSAQIETEITDAAKEVDDAAIQSDTVREVAEETKAQSGEQEAATEIAAAESAAREKMAQESAAKAAVEQQAIEKERLENERKAARLAAAQEQAQADKKAADQRAMKEAAEAERAAKEANVDKKTEEAQAVSQARQTESQAAANTAAAIQDAPLPLEKRSTNVPVMRIPPAGPITTPPTTNSPVLSLRAVTSNQAVATPALSSHRSSRGESSTDEYLAQLERLVLELNMELGRRRDDQQAADPMQQLSQRIIELNLENLALKEQLQRSGTPS